MVEEIFKIFGTFALKGKKDVDKDIDDVTGKAEKSESKISSAFKKIGTAVVTYFAVDKIVSFGKTCVEVAANVKAANSQFEQTFGDFATQADSAMNRVATSSGILQTRLQGVGTGIYAFAKASGMDSVEALTMMEEALQVTADSAAYYDRSLEDTAESLQSFLKGNFANDAALGVSCTETTRNIAANKLFKKSYNDLSEAQKQLTLLQMVKDANELSGAMGQAAREADGWENVTGNLKESWKQFQAVVGEPILKRAVPIVKSLADKIAELTGKVPNLYEKFANLRDRGKEIAEYAVQKFQPSIEKLQEAFEWLKDKTQPLIDKFKDFKDNTDFVQVSVDFLKSGIDFFADSIENTIGLVESVIAAFKDMKTWANENENAITLVAIATGTLATAIGAYNIARAVKNAGGIAEIAELAVLQVQIWALDAAEIAHTATTWLATTATTAFGGAMAFLTSPITLVILGIGALIAVGVLLYKNWDTIKAKAIEVFTKIKEKVSETSTKIKDKVVETVEKVKNKISEILDSIKNKASNFIESVKATFSDIGNWFNDNVIQPIKEFFIDLGNGIKTVFDTIVNIIEVAFILVGNIISAAVDIITLPFRFIWENCKEYVFQAFEWISNKINTAIEFIKNIVNIGFTFIKENIINPINDAKNKALEHFENLKNQVTEKINAAKEIVSNKFNEIKDNISNKVNEAKDKTIEHFENLKNGVNEKVNTAKGFVSGKFNEIKDNISNTINSAKESAIGHFENLKNGISQKVNTAKEFISSKFNEAKEKITTPINSAKDIALNIFENLKNGLSDKIESIKSSVSDKFNSIKEKAIQPINDMKEKIQGKINEIKNGFNNFSANFKMPHFTVRGSMNPTEWINDHSKIPSLKVEWYAKGGILNQPTVFGVNPATGRTMVGGEAGPEAVAPINTLLEYIRIAVAEQNMGLVETLQKIIDILLTYFPQFAELMDSVIILDDGTLVGKMAPKMNQELRKIHDYEERGN